jgi:plastocyanin
MQRSRTALLAAAALLAALGLGACGDDGGTGAASASTDCASTTVDIRDFAFEPVTVEVGRCGSVVWRNGDDQAHTSSADEGARWSTGNIAAGASSEPVTFDEAGTFTYHCALHPFMKATVKVA